MRFSSRFGGFEREPHGCFDLPQFGFKGCSMWGWGVIYVYMYIYISISIYIYIERERELTTTFKERGPLLVATTGSGRLRRTA